MTTWMTEPKAKLANFDLYEKLGEGLTAKVYRAQVRGDTTQNLAVKVFRHDNPQYNAELFKALSREVRAALTFDHPNIVKYHEV